MAGRCFHKPMLSKHCNPFDESRSNLMLQMMKLNWCQIALNHHLKINLWILRFSTVFFFYFQCYLFEKWIEHVSQILWCLRFQIDMCVWDRIIMAASTPWNACSQTAEEPKPTFTHVRIFVALCIFNSYGNVNNNQNTLKFNLSLEILFFVSHFTGDRFACPMCFSVAYLHVTVVRQ